MEDWQRDSSESCFQALVTKIILKPMLIMVTKGDCRRPAATMHMHMCAQQPYYNQFIDPLKPVASCYIQA